MTQHIVGNGAYTKNVWTSYSDIGKKIDGTIVTVDDYLKWENAYIQAVMLFLECLHVDSLKITDLEKRGVTKKDILNAGYPEEFFKLIQNNKYIKKELIPPMIQLILREYFW